MKERASILIVEDELITATSIQELLEEEDYRVTGIASSAAAALRLCSQAEPVPAVVVCDITIKGDVNGTELAAQLKSLYGCEIIFLTAYTDNRTLQDAFSKDPVMYVVKPYSDTQLLVAVQMAFFKLFNKEKNTNPGRLELTEREKEIAEMVGMGLSSKQIGPKLGISIETVKTHRRRMLQKNNISSFPHLIYLMNQES
ncbi:DNA-binding response regulator [Terrimonas ferruginea]|uniref:DNA-binding response regulator n=1 Tax=Terrimonas ferruginea TaxID=249 RepID=UPI000425D5FC|nr:DNA-binding response regulator [Terrimonas ferruginea]